MQVRIEKLVSGGAGIARTDDGVVFVEKVLPGEVVEVEITGQKKDYATARLERVLEPSSDRVAPVCPNFESVGCCSWDHIAYRRQVALKISIIREVLARHGRIEWEQPIVAATGPERAYRIRARFHIADTAGGDRLGFLAEKTHEVVPIASCAALMPELNQFVSEAADALAQRGLRRADEVRAVVSPDTRQVAAIFIRGRERFSWGDRGPLARVHGIEYRLRPDSFFQPNRYLLGTLLSEVVERSGQARSVLDLFCGSAFFSLAVARTGANVVGVDRRSVANAVWNVRHNRVDGVQLVKSSAWAYLVNTRTRPDTVILDPPRTGVGRNVAGRVATLGAERIVYVSCNPATLAPEARVLLDAGYRLESLTFIDQLPSTPHIETVSLFVRER